MAYVVLSFIAAGAITIAAAAWEARKCPGGGFHKLEALPDHITKHYKCPICKTAVRKLAKKHACIYAIHKCTKCTAYREMQLRNTCPCAKS